MTGYVRERLHFGRPVTPLFATLVLPAAERGYIAASRAQGGGAGAIELKVVDHHVYTAWSPLPAEPGPERALPDLVDLWEKETLPEARALLDDIRALLRPDVPARRAAGEIDVLARKLERLYTRHYELGQTMRSGLSGLGAFLGARGDAAPASTVETLLAPTTSALRDIDAWLAGAGPDLSDLVRDRPSRLDLDAPTWGEDPTLALRARRLAEGVGYAVGHARALERRAVAQESAMARFAPEERPVVAGILDALRRGRGAQQTLNLFAGELAVGATRGVALRAGARLSLGHDVVWLERDELSAALAGEPVPRDAIATRKASFARALAHPPPDTIGAPDLSDPAIAAMLGASSARGLGASAGRVRGPARIVERDEDVDQVRSGDIAIVAALEPTWTPIMHKAAAIVAETGGMLCHAAMVAREMGKPAVVGLAGARRRFRSGQEVWVDGFTGAVEEDLST